MATESVPLPRRVKKLLKMADAGDAEEIQKALQPFTEADPDRNTLKDAAKRLFPYEKRYVPRLPHPEVEDLRGSTLISTVGMSPEPIVLMALILSPRRLFLLHTETGRSTAQAIADDGDVQAVFSDPGRDIVFKEISETDAPHNYDVLEKQVLSRVRAGQKCVIDPTGGRKIMSVSVATVAFWRRIPMVYLHVEQRHRSIMPLTEEAKYIENPYEHFQDDMLRMIERTFNQGYYESALAQAEELKAAARDIGVRGLADLLRDVIAVYRDWDNFQHGHPEDVDARRIGSRLEHALESAKQCGQELFKPTEIARNLAFAHELEKSWEPGRQSIMGTHRIVDIVANARRRAGQGRYDDAVARLYRCVEMCASLRLVEQYGLKSPSNPCYDALAAKAGGIDKLDELYREASEPSQSLPPEGCPLGLTAQWTLLSTVEPRSPSTKAFQRLRGGTSRASLLTRRNHSLLGHGTSCVTAEDYREFETIAEQIAKQVIGKEQFQELLRGATHAAIRL